MYIPVMSLALSCNCFIVASLWLVLVGWVSFLGDSGVFSYGCIYVYVDMLVSVSEGFIRFTSLCGVVPKVVVRGIVRSLLVLSTFVLGGGGSVAIDRCYIYIFVYCTYGCSCIVRVGSGPRLP